MLAQHGLAMWKSQLEVALSGVLQDLLSPPLSAALRRIQIDPSHPDMARGVIGFSAKTASPV